MIRRSIGRIGYGLLVLLGVHLFTFVLFFSVNTPDDMARLNLGGKHVSAEQIANWKAERGYDRPLYLNAARTGTARYTDTVFWDRSASLLRLDFGRSDAQNATDIGRDIASRMAVSLQLAVPLFVLQIAASVGVALALVFFRRTAIDFWGTVACVAMLSVSTLFYVIVGQLLFARVLHLAPVSGYAPGLSTARFLVLPIGIAVLARVGSEARFYRAVLLEELGRGHVRAARAKGLAEWPLLWRHVLPNALIPIVTNAGAELPSVVLGSLIFESFFGIPGLGAYTLDAIAGQDFAIVRAMVVVGALVYVVSFGLVDAAYVWVDPRLRRLAAAP